MEAPSLETKAALELDSYLAEAEVEPTLTKDQHIAILKERLARRCALIDTIRHAYYRDVIVVKENLLARELHPSTGSVDERVHALPSVDLRDTLPLFAPSQTYLRVHPCDVCGGTLELVHGETQELNEARSLCAKAQKGEQNMKGIVHRLRAELKEATEISDALQQRLRALTKENAFTLEQLQISRKAEREQKTWLAELKSKLHAATATSESVSKLTQQLKELHAEHDEVTRQTKLFVRQRDDMQDELDALVLSHAALKADCMRHQSECEATKRQLDDMTDLKTHFATEFNALATKHKEQLHVSEIVQESLVKCKQDLATLSTKFEQTKRQLEDQLAGEEMERESTHERYLEEKKRCKQLTAEAERTRRDMTEYQELYAQVVSQADGVERVHQAHVLEEAALWTEEWDFMRLALDQALMRENDLASEVMKRYYDDDKDTDGDGDTGFFIPSYNEDDDEDDEDIEDSDSERQPTPQLPSRPMTPMTDAVADASRQPTPSSAGRQENLDRPGSVEMDSKKKRPVSRKTSKNGELAHLLSEMKDMQDKCKVLRNKAHEADKHVAQQTAKIDELTLTNQALEATIKDHVSENSERNQSETELFRTLKSLRENIEALKAEITRYERKVTSFEGFFSSIACEIYHFYQNSQLLAPIELLPVVVPEDEPSKATLPPEILAKRAIMKRELYEEKVVNNYLYVYNERIELYLVDLKRAYDFMLEVKHESLMFKKTCESQAGTIEKLQDSVERLKMALDTERTSMAKLERMSRITTNDLTQLQDKMRSYERESSDIELERNRLLEEKRKIAFIMMEKSKTLDREIDLNQQMAKKLQEKDSDMSRLHDTVSTLAAAVKRFEDAIQFRKDTNRDVGILVLPTLDDTSMQTDPWKPQGLILRQRNSSNQVPQRYEGPVKIMVACPSLDVLLGEKTLDRPVTSASMTALPSAVDNNNHTSGRRVHTADAVLLGASHRKPPRKMHVGRITLPRVNLPRHPSSTSLDPLVDNFVDGAT